MYRDATSNIPSKTEIDFTTSKAIEFTRWLLTALGIWPSMQKQSTTNEIYCSVILKILCYGTLLFTTIPATYHILCRETSLSAKVALSGPIFFFVVNIMKYTIIICHRKDIKKCIEHMERDWQAIEDQRECDMMGRNVLSSRKLTTMCAVFICIGGMSYHTILPFILGCPTSSGNFVEGHRPLVFPGYDIIFDPYITPAYEVVYFFHCLAALIVYTIVTLSCNLAASFVTHACGQIQIVVMKIEELVGYGCNKDLQFLRVKVGDIISRHTRVLRFTVDIEEVLREICLIEVLASTILICWLEYCVLMTWDESETLAILTYFALLIAETFQVHLFCYIGELLKTQFSEAGTWTYMTEWYRLPPKIAVAFILIIADAQVTRKITAGGLLELSLSSFASVISEKLFSSEVIMKTSLAYLNLLRTIDVNYYH